MRSVVEIIENLNCIKSPVICNLPLLRVLLIIDIPGKNTSIEKYIDSNLNKFTALHLRNIYIYFYFFITFKQ